MEDVVNYGTGTACQLDNMTVAGKQVLQMITTTCGLQATHHIIHVLYGPDSITTKSFQMIILVNSIKTYGKKL